MVHRSVSMLPVIAKTAWILVFACLLSPSSAKPSLEYWLTKLSPEDQPPPYIECRTSSECFDKEQCCKIGRQRFSIPECSPYGGPGDHCFPGAVATFKNLSYPDGVTVQFRGVYDDFCPCAFGLYCHHDKHICVSGDLTEAENVLDNFVRNPYNNHYNRFYNNL